MTHALSLFDTIAILYCIIAWFGYSAYANFHGKTYNLIKLMHRYRLQWIKNMVKRQDRRIDVQVIGNLQQTATFLIAISILSIGGALGMLAYGQKAVILLNEIPFISMVTPSAWFIKSAVILMIFIFSFFKLTWVVRQLNYAAILIMAAPHYKEGETDSIHELKRQTKYVTKTATMLTNAARHFNTGMRAFYFGLASLTWFINPVLYVMVATFVVLVLYRREYMSRTFILLS